MTGFLPKIYQGSFYGNGGGDSDDNMKIILKMYCCAHWNPVTANLQDYEYIIDFNI